MQPREQADKRPNIVLILADDLGYGDLSTYGNEVNRTPHLDRLAAEGLRFTDFHANGPMCTPTRAALMTGLYQNRFGRSFETALSPKTERDVGLPHEVVTLAEALQAAGYATGMYGKWHLGYQPPNLPTDHGFDDFRGLLTGDGDHHSHISRSGKRDWWHNEQVEMEEGYSADLITQHSIDFLERHQDKPSFIYVAHLAIHFPWQGPDEEAYRVEGGDYWDLSKLGPHAPGEVSPVVQRMVEAVDASVGAIMEAIRTLDSGRPTFVFFTSDNGGYRHYGGRFHGEISDNGPLRGQKTEVWEGGHRVPAIAWWPGRISAGRVTHETALTIDLMPTLTELAGIESTTLTSAQSQDGTSLIPLLFHDRPLAERTVFWRVGDQKAARRGPWKLVNVDGAAKLFNLDTDIGEQDDLAEQYPGRVNRLERELADWENEMK
jgi:arylsulfatase A-like enzyme